MRGNDQREKIKVAVIGCGTIANSAHIPSYLKCEEAEIKYFCDIIPERATAAVEKYGCGIAITDYRDALNDPEVTAVSVCTPNYAHKEISVAALAAGKSVLCEKPAARTLAEAEEMLEAQKKYGKILNIGVVNRFNDNVREIKKIIDAGTLGDIYHVYVSFRAHRSIPGLGGAFTTKEIAGGGALIDWGVHFLDLVLYALGGAKLKNVTCDAYCEMAKDMKSYKYTGMWAEDTKDIENGTNDVDDFISGYVRTDKASISFTGAWAQNVGVNEMYIDFLGDKKGIRLNYGGHFTEWSGETLEATVDETEIPNMYLCEDRAFIKSVTSGVKDKNNIENILESAKLLDYLYRSSEKKGEIAF